MKKLCSLLLVATLLFSCFGCGKEDSDGLTKVTLNEVAHSIFYAPQYVAIEKGYFKEEGIFNQTVADKFKNFVLSQGGIEDPMTLYKRFRGHEPKPEALLKRAGLV